jgi:predicted anti-sigma-YlaC factor YlaD
MTRPLWQLLTSPLNSDYDKPLTCEECFVILEYYADQLVAGTDPETLRESVRQHLDHCPGCREYFASQLDRLENSLKASDHHK